MKCRCKSKPAPVVTWYRAAEVVQESEKIAIKSSSTEEDIYELVLEIKDPSAPDGGTYRCHVKNEFGESNANLNLNIEAEPEPEGDGPIFLEKPRILSENNGKLVIMECKVKATPRPEITWTKEGKVLTETSQMKFFVVEKRETYDIRLELSEPNLEDSGLYKCNIQNHLGELNANLTLNIESESICSTQIFSSCIWHILINLKLCCFSVVPVIKDKPKIIKIIKKKTVVIECVVVSKFAPKAIWFKEKNEVSESTRHKVNVEQVKEGEFAVKLEISQVSDSDKGSYQLVAKNEKGEAVSQIVELVDIPAVDEEEKPPKPVIHKHLRNETIEETRTLELHVHLKHTDKTSKVIWYRNNKSIKESSFVKQTFDGKTASLRIMKTKADQDSGTYRCVIKNDSGADESSATVIVKKVAEKKKEEEEVEETVEVEEEQEEEEEEETEEKKGPFDVKLKKAKQNKTVISVSVRWSIVIAYRWCTHSIIGILCVCIWEVAVQYVPD